jgi:hypothetical protein
VQLWQLVEKFDPPYKTLQRNLPGLVINVGKPALVVASTENPFFALGAPAVLEIWSAYCEQAKTSFITERRPRGVSKGSNKKI